MKNIFFIIRYSVIAPNKNLWRTQLKTRDEIFEKILNKNRLEFRLDCLEKLTLLSIKSNKSESVNIHVLVLISDLLDESNLTKLKIALDKTSNTGNSFTYHIEKVKSGLIQSSDGHNTINDAVKFVLNKTKDLKGSPFATVRIDDDDAISTKYVDNLSKYISMEFSGFLISFPYGIEARVDEKPLTVLQPRHLYFIKNAQGLAYINYCTEDGSFLEDKHLHIFNTGNHTTVDERFPVIIKSDKPLYLRTISNHNDSTGSPNHLKLPPLKDPEVYKNYFGFLEHFYKDEWFSPTENNDFVVSKNCSYEWALSLRHRDRIADLEKRLKKN